jgi:hypothetical protein
VKNSFDQKYRKIQDTKKRNIQDRHKNTGHYRKYRTAIITVYVGHEVGTRYFIMDGNNRVELEAVEEEQDLGVHFSKDLKPSKQCILAAAKARKIIVLVRRHFRRMDKGNFILIYKTYGQAILGKLWSRMWNVPSGSREQQRTWCQHYGNTATRKATEIGTHNAADKERKKVPDRGV